MTVIVYSKRQLVFDKRVTEDTMLLGKATKGIELPFGACAGCGEMQTIQAFLDWCALGADINSKDKFGLHETADNFQGIMIKHKEVYLIDDKFYPYKVKAKHYVLGSGAHFALGALHMGATAEEAATVAIKCDTSCGDGIEVFNI